MGSQDRDEHVPRCRPCGQLQSAAVRSAQSERQAAQLLFGVDADDLHQTKGFAVSTDQYVLAVVQRQPLVQYPTGAPTHLWRGLKQANLPTVHAGMYRSGEPRPASADDGQSLQNLPNACIFQASHSLRTGVNDTRCVSTGNRASAISCKSVR